MKKFGDYIQKKFEMTGMNIKLPKPELLKRHSDSPKEVPLAEDE